MTTKKRILLEKRAVGVNGSETADSAAATVSMQEHIMAINNKNANQQLHEEGIRHYTVADYRPEAEQDFLHTTLIQHPPNQQENTRLRPASNSCVPSETRGAFAPNNHMLGFQETPGGRDLGESKLKRCAREEATILAAAEESAGAFQVSSSPCGGPQLRNLGEAKVKRSAREARSAAEPALRNSRQNKILAKRASSPWIPPRQGYRQKTTPPPKVIIAKGLRSSPNSSCLQSQSPFIRALPRHPRFEGAEQGINEANDKQDEGGNDMAYKDNTEDERNNAAKSFRGIDPDGFRLDSFSSDDKSQDDSLPAVSKSLLEEQSQVDASTEGDEVNPTRLDPSIDSEEGVDDTNGSASTTQVPGEDDGDNRAPTSTSQGAGEFSSTSDLVVATRLDLPYAVEWNPNELIDQPKDCCGSTRKYCTMGILMVAVVFAVALAVTLTQGNKVAVNKGGNVTMVSSVATASPSLSPEEYVKRLLPNYTLQSIKDPLSAQFQAFNFVIKDPQWHNYPDWRIRQRLGLATFYYATDGRNWKDKDWWLDYTKHECQWFSKPVELQIIDRESGGWIRCCGMNWSKCASGIRCAQYARNMAR